MKFICLGYLDTGKWGTLSEDEQKAMVDACLAYDIELRKGGHFAGGEALLGAETATTIRWNDGKVSVSDGPFAETKEMLGGILILEAADKDEAIRLMTRHPGIRMGSFEIRPADEQFMAQHPVLKSI
ncbi:MAG: YCII-related protein [Steroidobacteraceae bacterium]|nr:YCII-related protein [Steroidobacteraceae bacterium]